MDEETLETLKSNVTSLLLVVASMLVILLVMWRELNDVKLKPKKAKKPAEEAA